MRKLIMAIAALEFAASPVAAIAREHGPEMTRPGAFAGFVVKLPLGAAAKRKPTAALSLSPTRARVTSDGFARNSIGDGFALSLSPRGEPELTLAGTRADMALGLRAQGRKDAPDKLGISTGGWIAIGVGTVAVIVGGLYLWADHIADCEERDNGCP